VTGAVVWSVVTVAVFTRVRAGVDVGLGDQVAGRVGPGLADVEDAVLFVSPLA